MAIEMSKVELPSNEVVDHVRLGRPSHSNSSTSDHVENPLQSKMQHGESLRPSLRELVASYRGEWACIDGKYGHYEGIPPPSFHTQAFSNMAHPQEEGSEEPWDDGCQEPLVETLDAHGTPTSHKFLEGPLFHAFAPVFNWEEEKTSIPGLRAPSSPYVSPLGVFSFSVEVVSLTMQAGLVEPISGTVSLYHKDRREKISEDFHFSFSPEGWAKSPLDQQRKVLFTLDKPSPSICLLVQLERTATEDDGVKASAYSKKDVTSLSERDSRRLAAWAASVPFKEPLAWTFIPIFDKAVTNGLGGFGLESSLPATPMSGRSTPRTPWSSFTGYGSGGNSAYGTPRHSIDATSSGLSFSGTPKRGAAAEEANAWQAVQVDVPMFNKVKASYTEDSLHDQKKAQKAIRASMKLLIERLSGRPSTTGRAATPLPALESRCATPPSLLGPPLRPRVNGQSSLASLEGHRGLELEETGGATKARWDEGRDRRDSTGSVRTVLDGPESGQTTPASGKESGQDADIGMVLASEDRFNLRRVFPLSNDRAGASEIKQLEEERVLPRGASSSGDTDEWTVVERASGSDEEPRAQPFASTSGRIIESFLDLNEGEARHRGGPVRALDFRSLDRSEPYTELIHLLYVYPLSLHTAKKKNLLVKVELRDDDSHPDNPAMKAIFPKEVGGPMLRSLTTQVALSTKTCLFHDEIKLRLPTAFTPQHHLLFTFLQPSLRQKGRSDESLTVLGYSVLPLTMSTQVLRSDGSLPVVKELLPMYLNDFVKSDMSYLDDGRPLFRLRLRLCSTIHPTNERLQAFHAEYDKHMLGGGGLPSSALLSAINHLRSMDFVTLQQYLHPTLTMLLRLIGDGGETLQVASFRALVNILTRIQQESVDGSDQNRILVHFIDLAFDDWKGEMHPVYPGLCSVWRSLARSKAKGYRVGPVYEDVLAMAWVFLELITKSIALEAGRASSRPASPAIVEDEALSAGVVLLNTDVFHCVRSLFDCLLVEVAEKAKTGPAQAKRLNTCLAYFCHDLLTVIDPVQVYELIASYMGKNSGALPSVLHDLKLTFLRVLCDHDKYVEFPGRAQDERNYLASLLVEEVLVGIAHEDPLIRSKAVRLISFIMCKHQFDIQSQDEAFKEYTALLYLPLVEQVLRKPSLLTNLAPSEQRALLVCVLTVLESLDGALVTKLWGGREERARALFELLELALELFQWMPESTRSDAHPATMGSSLRLYSEKLSPSVQQYITAAIRQHEKTLQTSLEQSYARQGIAHKVNLREALAQIQASRKAPPAQQCREQLPSFLRMKLELWEGNLSTRIGLHVLRVMHLFSDYCTSEAEGSPPPPEALLFPALNAFLAQSQSLAVWTVFVPLFRTFLERHGHTFLEPENSRFVKETAFHLLKLMVSSLKGARNRGAVCLLLLLRAIHHRQGTLQSTLTLLSLTLSELLSSIQVLDSYAAPGSPPTEPPAESRAQVARLKGLLEELASQDGCERLLAEVHLSKEHVAGFREERAALEDLEDGELEKGKESSEVKDGVDLHLPTVEAFESELTPQGEGTQPLRRLLLPAAENDSSEGSHDALAANEPNASGSGEIGMAPEVREGDGSASEPAAETPSDLTAEDSFFSIFDTDTSRSPGGGKKPDGWADVSKLMRTLVRALDSSVQHSVHVSQTATWHDPSESYARMAVAYSHVLDLRTLWLLNLCEYHQGKQAWAEAAQCALMIAGIVMQALIHCGNHVWTRADLSHVRQLCPSLPEALDDPESTSSKISVDTALRYLQMAHHFAVKAALFHACTDLMELQLPAYKSRGDYKQLATTHEMLREIYEAIRDQELDPSFRDANYYRVGFYGSIFGPLDRTEFVYRESSAVRLGDMIETLGSTATGDAQNRIGIISDSRVVQNLAGDAAYLQITSLEAVLAPQTDSSANPRPPCSMGVSEFSFDTGFVKEGQTPGGLETQWKRRTVIGVAGSFPSVVRRLKVVRTAVSEVTPLENAVAIVLDRTRAVRTEMERPVPVLTSIQRLLQGSVALQVNSGVLGVCKAFLEPTRGLQESMTNPPLQSMELERLKAAVVEFVGVCKAAVKVHARLMGEDDQEFHVQLVQGLQGLIFEISAFIPTVLNQM